MKYLLIGVDDATDMVAFDKHLHNFREVKTVETVASTELADFSGTFQRNMSIPGLPLTDAEIALLAADMNADTSEAIPHEDVFKSLEEKIVQWSNEKA